MQKTIILNDSDDNEIMALVEYNPEYLHDFKVLYAVVELKTNGEKCCLSNPDVVRFQYINEIVQQLREE
jgi:hypothetical protein